MSDECKMYPVMGGFIDGSLMCHPDDRKEKPGQDFIVLRNDFGDQTVFYRYEFWPGIERWLFKRSSKYPAILFEQ